MNEIEKKISEIINILDEYMEDKYEANKYDINKSILFLKKIKILQTSFIMQDDNKRFTRHILSIDDYE